MAEPSNQLLCHTTRNSTFSTVHTNNEVAIPQPVLRTKLPHQQRSLPPSLQTDFLPDEILLALTQRRPDRKLEPLPTDQKVNVGRTSSVWHSPIRRKKFEHLVESTACVCGAGRDLSFLCDMPQATSTDASTLSAAELSSPGRRKSQAVKRAMKSEIKLPDTLLPQEFLVVKSKGVSGLHYHDEKFTTAQEDHEKHAVAFPPMYPTSRFDVLRLKASVYDILAASGLGDHIETDGPTQMHRLLQLVKKEQDIYNLYMHELIRQTTVECAERGELLANLRRRYANLLTAVPEQIMGMHNEVVAQRALDRRLKEELIRFQGTVNGLTQELSLVKQHERRQIHDARAARQELDAVLEELKKNSDLLHEYCGLYEQQRHRLERQVATLAGQMELWNQTAYTLSLRVIASSGLSVAVELQACEQEWRQLASHFTARLAKEDAAGIARVQGYVESWQQKTVKFAAALSDRDRRTKATLELVQARMTTVRKDFREKFVSKHGHLKRPLNPEEVVELLNFVLFIEENLSQEAEQFGGDEMINQQERMAQMKRLVLEWTDLGIKVFNRHCLQEDGSQYPDLLAMFEINKLIDKLMSEFTVRLMGDNGVARCLIAMVGLLETWHTRLVTAAVEGPGRKPLPESEWMRFYLLLEDWIGLVAETHEFVGQTRPEDAAVVKQEGADSESAQKASLDVNTVVQAVEKWASASRSGLDSEDTRLAEAATRLSTEMVRWLIQALLRLAPDRPGNSVEAAQAARLASVSPHELTEHAVGLTSRVKKLTTYLSQCCSSIVTEAAQLKQEQQEDAADFEVNQLKQFVAVGDTWVNAVNLMLLEMGKPAIPDAPSTVGTMVSSDTEATIVDVSSKIASAEALAPEESVQEEGKATTQNLEPPHLEKEASSLVGKIDEEEEDQLVQVTPAASYVQGLGVDQNTHSRPLLQDPGRPPQDVVTLETGVVADTPDTENAYRALHSVLQLQTALAETEARAQLAENSAMSSELALAEVTARIEATKKKLAAIKSEIEASEQKPPPELSVTLPVTEPSSRPKVQETTGLTVAAAQQDTSRPVSRGRSPSPRPRSSGRPKSHKK